MSTVDEVLRDFGRVPNVTFQSSPPIEARQRVPRARRAEQADKHGVRAAVLLRELSGAEQRGNAVLAATRAEGSASAELTALDRGRSRYDAAKELRRTPSEVNQFGSDKPPGSASCPSGIAIGSFGSA